MHLTFSWTLLSLLIGGSALADTAPPPPPPPRDAANAQFWWRIDNPSPNPIDAPRSHYQPMISLRGAPSEFLPIAAPNERTIPEAALEAAAKFVELSNGQAIIVVHRGVVQLQRYYQGGDEKTEFSSASFAKTLGAAAIGVALREGKIQSLDQQASQWLTEWRDPARQDITVRQLLTMSGGFRNKPSRELGSHYIQMHYGADVEAIVRAAPIAYPPGSDFAWDNDNSHALALLLERATGKKFVDYVSEKIWQPLGADDGEQMLDRPGGRAMAYCCLWAKPRDWIRVGQMLLNGGKWQQTRILDESFVQELQSPSAQNPYYGFTVNVGAAWKDDRLNRTARSNGDDKVGTIAPDLYYLSAAGGLQMAMVPSEDLLVLRVGKASKAWRDHVLPNLLVSAIHAERAIQSAKQ